MPKILEKAGKVAREELFSASGRYYKVKGDIQSGLVLWKVIKVEA